MTKTERKFNDFDDLIFRLGGEAFLDKPTTADDLYHFVVECGKDEMSRGFYQALAIIFADEKDWLIKMSQIHDIDKMKKKLKRFLQS